MKRCPSCEFIYEDDQRLCDMDGQTLVFEQAEAALPQPQKPGKSRFKSVVLPAGAGLVLAGALSVVYYAAFTSPRMKSVSAASSSPKSQQLDINSRVPSSTQSSLASTGAASALPSSTPAPPETPEVTPEEPRRSGADKTARAHVSRTDGRLAIPRGIPPLPRLRPLPTLPDAQPMNRSTKAPVTSRPNSSAQRDKPDGKKDSKFNSLLKKTGRVLTKPFRL
jgi:hypothetical protein